MDTILHTTDIVKKYGNRTILNKISMHINRGDIYGFIGKNGAGKTTFMRVILSLTTKDEGEVEFFDHKIIEEVGLKIGSLIELPGLYKNATAQENLKRFSILYGADDKKIDNILELVGLGDVGDRSVKNFSLGMRQRLGIAIALLGDPEFLVLDEPINGLDPEGIKEIRDVILRLNKEKGITFLISSHLLDELSKVVTRYGIIDNGVLIEEIEADALREKCKNKFIFEVDNAEKASKIISKMVDSKEIVTKKNSVEVHANLKDSASINKALVEAGIGVSSLYSSSDSLEEYFMKRIGG